jgi:cytochrome P450
VKDVAVLDRERIRALFDLREVGATKGTPLNYYTDPYPQFHRLRESGPVHEGPLHDLMGWTLWRPSMYSDASRPEFCVFDFETCDAIFRDEERFRSAPYDVDPTAGGGIENSLLRMNGSMHRRYRTLVQPSFVPKKAEWWITEWIRATVDALIDGFEATHRAELNVDFAAAIPTLTITGSFGLAVEDALAIRTSASMGFQGELDTLFSYVMPIIEARRSQPENDLISVLCQAEVTDEDGVRHRLTDEEIFSFSHLLLLAGSGTTWKQIGITLTALLTRPATLDAIRDDRTLLRAAIEESMRWWPNDPVFTRWAKGDVELAGVHVPAGSIVHVVLGSANRDPKRWENPDDYDIFRPLLPALGFGGGPHVCIGQHVARAEMHTAIDGLVTRLPNLRLDPDAVQPEIMGLVEGGGGAYEMGVNELNVIWD